MKRVLLFLMIFGLIPAIAFSQKKETRSVSGFTGIDASSVFNITITKGDTESIVIEADDNVMQYVRSEVRSGVLHLYIDNAYRVRNIKILKASVVMKNLESVTLSGACKLTADDLFTPDKFQVDCSGASSMTANVNTNQLTVETSGASNIRIKSEITGGTSMDVSGVSKIWGELKANSVVLTSSGVCSVELTGSASDIKIDASGTSNVKAGDFAVKNADIVSSGTSVITVNATDALKVSSSGAASVNYKGSPSLQVNNSRAAKVNKI